MIESVIVTKRYFYGYNDASLVSIFPNYPKLEQLVILSNHKEMYMRILCSLSLLFFISFPLQAAVQGTKVKYDADGVTLQGYLAYDDSIKGKRPGVLVVHEWWGHNEYARKRVRMLADMGYVALAVDMYGEGKNAAHPKEAGEFSSAVRKNMPVAKARFRAAMALLKEHEATDASQLAAIGYCFGGAIVLDMARTGMDLAGVVSFHGSLTTDIPAKAGDVKAKMLVLNGESDKFIKPEAIEAFKQEMNAAKVDYEFISYPGAVHAFSNPEATINGEKFGIPLAYHAAADRLSWTQMQVFFNELFIP